MLTQIHDYLRVTIKLCIMYTYVLCSNNIDKISVNQNLLSPLKIISTSYQINYNLSCV